MLRLKQYETYVENSLPPRGVILGFRMFRRFGINASLSATSFIHIKLLRNHTFFLRITPEYFAEWFGIIFISEVHITAY
jgi:hypothetical protein